MNPNEALKIIQSLADGVHPDTGEVLSDESPFNDGKVVRALFMAVQALQRAAKREQKESALPDQAGKPWSDEEDQALLGAFDAGQRAKALAVAHGRTDGAIAARLVRKGRIKERADAFAPAAKAAPVVVQPQPSQWPDGFKPRSDR